MRRPNCRKQRRRMRCSRSEGAKPAARNGGGATAGRTARRHLFGLRLIVASSDNLAKEKTASRRSFPVSSGVADQAKSDCLAAPGFAPAGEAEAREAESHHRPRRGLRRSDKARPLFAGDPDAAVSRDGQGRDEENGVVFEQAVSERSADHQRVRSGPAVRGEAERRPAQLSSAGIRAGRGVVVGAREIARIGVEGAPTSVIAYE